MENSKFGITYRLGEGEIENFACESDGNDGGDDFLHYTCITRRKGVECWLTIRLRWHHLHIQQA